MTRRRKSPAVIGIDTETLRHSAIITGPAGSILGVLTRTAIPRQYDSLRSAWLVPKRLADDVAALAELGGCRVEYMLGGVA